MVRSVLNALSVLAAFWVMATCMMWILGVSLPGALLFATGLVVCIIALVVLFAYTRPVRPGDALRWSLARRKAKRTRDFGDLLRIELENHRYKEAKRVVRRYIPKNASQSQHLQSLIGRLAATEQSAKIVSLQAGTTIGQDTLIRETLEFIVGKSDQVARLYEHNLDGPALAAALGRIDGQIDQLHHHLHACQEDLVAASGRDYWDEHRIRRIQRQISLVSETAQQLN